MAGRPSPFDFRLIVKCTRRCNYTCEYCLDRRSTADADLDFANLARIFHLLGQLEDTKKIQIIWHGGEPLLRGIRFFEKMLFLQAEMVPSHVQVTHVLQTNGSLVDDEWASFFQACGFHLGVSLDGPKAVQDANRPAGKRQSSYEPTLNGISLLEQHGVRVGLLSVANDRVLNLGAVELWGFFKEHGFNRFGVLSLRGNQPDPEAELDYNRRYGQFIVELMRLWLAEDDPDIQIREFRSKLDMFFGLAPGVCKDGGACVGKYYGIEPSGQVYHCDKFCSDSAWRIGHLSDLTRSPVLVRGRGDTREGNTDTKCVRAL